MLRCRALAKGILMSGVLMLGALLNTFKIAVNNYNRGELDE